VYVLKSLSEADWASCSSARARRPVPTSNSTRARAARLVGFRRRRRAPPAERCWSSSIPPRDGRVAVRRDAGLSRRCAVANLRRFDKGGEAFYDQISALHKSVRGSDPDASLYWLCACSTAAPIRSISAAASCAWRWRTSAWPTRARCRSRSTPVETYERLGSPEGELALARR
jgi:putative ATPase